MLDNLEHRYGTSMHHVKVRNSLKCKKTVPVRDYGGVTALLQQLRNLRNSVNKLTTQNPPGTVQYCTYLCTLYRLSRKLRATVQIRT